ncbi:MAG TPA: magnesium/cobalt transporter CorA [Planctomycetota bacterium]|nr:magnesium/cobalt transporter CorA [Planctomycetota bacterium]
MTAPGGKRRQRHRGHHPPGTSPGTLVVPPGARPPRLRVIAYGPEHIEERELADPQQLRALLGRWPVLWVDVDGLGDVAVIEALGALFGLHRLALEDVTNLHQRPKAQRFGEHLFVVARMPVGSESGALETEQLSLFIGSDFLLTFQERPGGDCFDPVRARLRAAKGRSRGAGPDYLAYALLDSVVDAYYPVLESCGERLDALEDELFVRVAPGAARRVHQVRRDLLTVRRAVWPLREELATLVREPDPLVAEETRVYLRDCYDHAVQMIDLLETYRDLGAGLMEIYLSLLSHRMNEIMKVLTITATIFIPLTFIVGVYGMNFDTGQPWNMPELLWPWGYPAVMLSMLALAVGMLLYFRRKGWLGGGEGLGPPPPRQ